MFDRLREDVRCVLERDPAARSAFEVLTCYPGVHALWMHRLLLQCQQRLQPGLLTLGILGQPRQLLAQCLQQRQRRLGQRTAQQLLHAGLIQLRGQRGQQIRLRGQVTVAEGLQQRGRRQAAAPQLLQLLPALLERGRRHRRPGQTRHHPGRHRSGSRRAATGAEALHQQLLQHSFLHLSRASRFAFHPCPWP